MFILTGDSPFPVCGKLETEKTHILSSELYETETPKNEKLGKIVERKNKPFYSIHNETILILCISDGLCGWEIYSLGGGAGDV